MFWYFQETPQSGREEQELSVTMLELQILANDNECGKQQQQSGTLNLNQNPPVSLLPKKKKVKKDRNGKQWHE